MSIRGKASWNLSAYPSLPPLRAFTDDERNTLYIARVTPILDFLDRAYATAKQNPYPSPETFQFLNGMFSAALHQRPIFSGYKPSDITLDNRLAERGLTASEAQKTAILKYVPKACLILSGKVWRWRHRWFRCDGRKRKGDVFDADNVRFLDAALEGRSRHCRSLIRSRPAPSRCRQDSTPWPARAWGSRVVAASPDEDRTL